MTRFSFICLSLFFALFLFSCDRTEHEQGDWNTIAELHGYNQEKITIQQGFAGTLIMKEGNCMPMVGLNPSDNGCRSYPVKRTIRIYEYTTADDVEGYGPFFTAVNTLLRQRITTDHEGFFQVKLSPGTYSVFIEEDNKLYANSWDGQGGIRPVTVTKGQLGYEQLTIDYAVY
ncbi:hypothetical protein [Gaoshiqia sp. Z1-71]|uniref:hypothetical protein n=1 Tax=Gaoshiqia hydrogeniformans TaxID=3290090 RepID=UPI003BF88135